MTPILELVLRGILLGLGGAALMDAWALLLRKGFAVRGLDYALLGRWVGHMTKGRFVHDEITSAQPILGERALGWLTHYAIAIAFAVVLLVLAGAPWANAPTIVPPMLLAIATLAAPWFIMQPAMGLGFAASRVPRPGVARLRNGGTHVMYGLGVYAAATAIAAVRG